MIIFFMFQISLAKMVINENIFRSKFNGSYIFLNALINPTHLAVKSAHIKMHIRLIKFLFTGFPVFCERFFELSLLMVDKANIIMDLSIFGI